LQVRNKPTAPPKKPEKAPFFLPTVPSLSGDHQFIAPSGTGPTETGVVVGAKRNRHNKPEHRDFQTIFLEHLHSCSNDKECKFLAD